MTALKKLKKIAAIATAAALVASRASAAEPSAWPDAEGHAYVVEDTASETTAALFGDEDADGLESIAERDGAEAETEAWTDVPASSDVLEIGDELFAADAEDGWIVESAERSAETAEAGADPAQDAFGTEEEGTTDAEAARTFDAEEGAGAADAAGAAEIAEAEDREDVEGAETAGADEAQDDGLPEGFDADLPDGFDAPPLEDGAENPGADGPNEGERGAEGTADVPDEAAGDGADAAAWADLEAPDDGDVPGGFDDLADGTAADGEAADGETAYETLRAEGDGFAASAVFAASDLPEGARLEATAADDEEDLAAAAEATSEAADAPTHVGLMVDLAVVGADGTRTTPEAEEIAFESDSWKSTRAEVVVASVDGAEAVAVPSEATGDGEETIRGAALGRYAFAVALKRVYESGDGDAVLAVETSDVGACRVEEAESSAPAPEGVDVLSAAKIATEEGSDAVTKVTARVGEDAELDPGAKVVLRVVSGGETAYEVEVGEDGEASAILENGEDGAEVAIDSGLRRTTLVAKGEGPEGGFEAEFSGMAPIGATAEASEASDEAKAAAAAWADPDGSAAAPARVSAAYDLKIKDGDGSWQPKEGEPILVTIRDPALSVGEGAALVHVADDGTAEDAGPFEIADGALTFEAKGFSVYAVVEGPEAPPTTYSSPSSVSEIANGKFLVSITKAGKGTCYFRNYLNSKRCVARTADGDMASAREWLFEPTGDAGDEFLLSTVSNGGAKTYLTIGADSYASLGASGGSVFKASAGPTDGTFYFETRAGGKTYWLNFSGGGDGFKGWTEKNEDCVVRLVQKEPFDDDPFGLDGAEHGLANAADAISAYMASVRDDGTVAAARALARTNPVTRDGKLFVAADADVSEWRFRCVRGDEYAIETTVDGRTKRLAVENDALVLTDDPDATARVEAGTGRRAGKIRLLFGNMAVAHSNGSFVAANATSSDSEWLSFVERSDLTEEDFVRYTATKIAASDPALTTGKKTILYVRKWNEDEKKYEYFAIDHDGSLIPCFEDGDSIRWIGSRVPTAIWEFTEYRDETTNEPNGYYELKNSYSGEFLSPSLSGGLFSDEPRGLNLEGRANGAYYSTIMAWDEGRYAYAALATDDAGAKTVKLGRAESFYFATYEETGPVDPISPVATIDNEAHGIEIKMVDFDGNRTQNATLGSTAGGLNKPPTQGLLSTDLDGGYPTATLTGASLETLFGAAEPANHLFLASVYEGTGYYEFDSTRNFATLDGGEFTLYSALGTSDGSSRPSLKHGQFLPFDDLVPGLFASVNDTVEYDAEMRELSEDDPLKHEKLYLVPDPNYHFGLELSASFVQTPSGLDDWGHDIVYEFTGDDDFWLYVDGELVIDLGGIHSALAGKVNFATGDVVVNGVESDLRTIFESNYRGRNPDADDDEVEAWLEERFGESGTKFVDYSSHDMRIFFMERGAGASNLHMRFNLASVNPGQVTLEKTVSGAQDEDYQLAEYPFQVFYRLPGEDEFLLLPGETDGVANVRRRGSGLPTKHEAVWTPPGKQEPYESVFFLSADSPVTIHLPDDAIDYYVREIAINPEVYDEVDANGTALEGTPAEGGALDFACAPAAARVRPNLTFDNHANPEGMRTLTIEKRLVRADGVTPIEGDPTGFDFRLYLGAEGDGELPPARVRTYYVRDPEGRYCEWDEDAATFAPIHDGPFEEMDAEEKEEATFHTSVHGAISNIPAGYRVELRGLFVGTKFRIEERENEIPDGYEFLRYEREGSTYVVEDGETVNAGMVRASQSPCVAVYNTRVGVVKMEKTWSDEGYADWRGDVFFALYKDGRLVEGSTKKLSHPGRALEWRLGELSTGESVEDYLVYEAKVEGDWTADADGTLAGDFTVEPIPEGGTATVEAATLGRAAEPVVYSVSYGRGTASGAAGNVKTDAARNSRAGVRVVKTDIEGRPLEGARFSVSVDGGEAETRASDEEGLVTIVPVEPGSTFSFAETKAPVGHVAPAQAATLSFDADGTPTAAGPRTELERDAEGGGWTLYVRNAPRATRLVKTDLETGAPLEGARFAVYAAVPSSAGGTRPDYSPIPGQGALVTGADGSAPGFGAGLVPGAYYLRETQAPEGHDLLEAYVPFSIAPTGELTLGASAPAAATARAIDGPDGSVTYELRVADRASEARVTTIIVECLVGGNAGDRNAPFDFSIESATGADGAALAATCEYEIVGADGEVESSGTVSFRPDGSGASKAWFDDGSGSGEKDGFQLSHGKSIRLRQVPEGTSFVARETPKPQYRVSVTTGAAEEGGEPPEWTTSADGTTAAAVSIGPDGAKATFLNVANFAVPTGRETGAAKTAAAAAADLAALAAFFAVYARRRKKEASA